MNLTNKVIMKQHPQISRWILFAAEALIIISAIIAILSILRPGPIQLMLFFLIAEAFIILGILLYLGVTISGFLRQRGVSRMRFLPGEIIFRQGDPGDFVYTIVSGEVEVMREEPEGEKLLARLGPGQYFGEMALVSTAPRTATVRTITEVEVITLSRADFTTLYAYLPDLHQSVDKVMQQRHGLG